MLAQRPATPLPTTTTSYDSSAGTVEERRHMVFRKKCDVPGGRMSRVVPVVPRRQVRAEAVCDELQTALDGVAKAKEAKAVQVDGEGRNSKDNRCKCRSGTVRELTAKFPVFAGPKE